MPIRRPSICTYIRIDTHSWILFFGLTLIGMDDWVSHLSPLRPSKFSFEIPWLLEYGTTLTIQAIVGLVCVSPSLEEARIGFVSATERFGIWAWNSSCRKLALATWKTWMLPIMFPYVHIRLDAPYAWMPHWKRLGFRFRVFREYWFDHGRACVANVLWGDGRVAILKLFGH
jgi:prepilin-type processing-associated H-X9-DG protein